MNADEQPELRRVCSLVYAASTPTMTTSAPTEAFERSRRTGWAIGRFLPYYAQVCVPPRASDGAGWRELAVPRKANSSSTTVGPLERTSSATRSLFGPSLTRRGECRRARLGPFRQTVLARIPDGARCVFRSVEGPTRRGSPRAWRARKRAASRSIGRLTQQNPNERRVTQSIPS